MYGLNDKELMEEDVLYDFKIRENLKKLYSNLVKDIEPLTYDAFKDNFSLDDDFVIMRQKSEDVFKEESFDEEGNLADLMLGENANFHIDKHMASLKLVGPPRRVKIPNTHSGNSFIGEHQAIEYNHYYDDERNAMITYENASNEQSNKKVIRNPFAKNNKVKTKTSLPATRQADSKGTLEYKPKDVIKFHKEQERKDRWSQEIKEMKEKSKDIVDNLFKTSNLTLDSDLDRPLPYHERFNNGDSAYVPPVNPDEMTLMDKLIQYAKQNSEDANKSTTETLDANPSSSTSSHLSTDVKQLELSKSKTKPKNKFEAQALKELSKPKIVKFVSRKEWSDDESSDDSDGLNEENDAWFNIRKREKY